MEMRGSTLEKVVEHAFSYNILTFRLKNKEKYVQ